MIVVINFRGDSKKEAGVKIVEEGQVLSFWGRLSILIEWLKAYGFISSTKYFLVCINEVKSISEAIKYVLVKKLWVWQKSKI